MLLPYLSQLMKHAFQEEREDNDDDEESED